MTYESVAKQLQAAGIEDFAGEAEQIVAAGPRQELLTTWIQRRISGEPLALILGTTRFMGISMRVGPGALVPRPETELLAATALRELEACVPPARIAIDMCCGVGNVGVVLALRRPDLRVWLSDLTEPCVSAAQANVASLGLSDRVTILRGDLFEPLRGLGMEGTVDLIACNPPYISTSRLASESAHLLRSEPREAFDAGPYGISIHQRVINEAPAFLKPGGRLVFEFGAGQGRQMQLLFRRSGQFDDPCLIKNAGGEDRVVLARLQTGNG
jgi:release factor glutamine methyltransferase